MSAHSSSTPDDPDLAILLVAAARVMTDRLLEAMQAAGLPMRPAWGYVVRAVHDEPLPLGRLAELLGVTKQAAQQTVDDMAAAGLAERRPDPGDARRRLIALTPEGRRVRALALQTSAAVEAEVAAAHGDGELAALRRTLTGLVERHGDLADVQARRARAL